MHPEAIPKENKSVFLRIDNFNSFLNTEEIAASKAYTIGRRGSYKDYVDLYYIFLNNYSNLAKTIELAEKKYPDEFNSRLFLEQLIYLDDVTDEKIDFIKDSIDKDSLKVFFEEKIKEIEF